MRNVTRISLGIVLASILCLSSVQRIDSMDAIPVSLVYSEYSSTEIDMPADELRSKDITKRSDKLSVAEGKIFYEDEINLVPQEPPENIRPGLWQTLKDPDSFDGNDAIYKDDSKYIALTFDDGPHPKHTAWLLDELKERNVAATFFVLGSRIMDNQDLIKRMVDEGHLVGNHTFGHKLLSSLSRNDIEEQINKTNDLIVELTGFLPTTMRPPYGSRNERLLDIVKDKNMAVVMWSIDPEDWKKKSPASMNEHVKNRASEGDIILFHDMYETSVKAAVMVVDDLMKQGYVFVTVDELINKYSSLEAGGVYRTGHRREN